jgi:hypothetical protein
MGGGSSMSAYLREMVEKRKELLINKLLKHGIYKLLNQQLYELPLSELEREYKKIDSVFNTVVKS